MAPSRHAGWLSAGFRPITAGQGIAGGERRTRQRYLSDGAGPRTGLRRSADREVTGVRVLVELIHHFGRTPVGVVELDRNGPRLHVQVADPESGAGDGVVFQVAELGDVIALAYLVTGLLVGLVELSAFERLDIAAHRLVCLLLDRAGAGDDHADEHGQPAAAAQEY